MYIPISFFGGACNSVTGSSYYYYNRTAATTDLFTFPQFCNNANSVSISLPASQSVQFCTSGQPSGVNTTTVLVDNIFNVTGSCSTLYPNQYTLTLGGLSSYQYTNPANNTYEIESAYVTAGTYTVISYSTPQIILARGSVSIVNNGIYTASVYPNIDTNFKNNLYKLVTLEYNGAQSTSIRFLGPDGTLNEKALASQAGKDILYNIVSSTTPQVYATGSIGNLRFMTNLDGNTVLSSSCYTYSCYNADTVSVTLNYVNCSNVSSSISVAAGVTSNFCAKVNSVTPPTSMDGYLRIIGTCS